MNKFLSLSHGTCGENLSSTLRLLLNNMGRAFSRRTNFLQLLPTSSLSLEAKCYVSDWYRNTDIAELRKKLSAKSIIAFLPSSKAEIGMQGETHACIGILNLEGWGVLYKCRGKNIPKRLAFGDRI